MGSIAPFFMDKRRYYEEPRVAEGYEASRFGTPSGRRTHEVEMAALKSLFTRGEKIVELACGTGRLLRALRAHGHEVSGIDRSPAMLSAGSAGPLLDVQVGDVFRLPFPDSSFDAAYCMRFTNHHPDLRGFFSECRRILRGGGRLVFDSMRWSPLLWDSDLWGGRNHPVSDRRVRGWLGETGFTVEEVRPLFPIGPYLLGRLPLPLTDAILAARGIIPAGVQAVAVWHVRRAD